MMPNFLEILDSLKGSYSGAFVIFWVLMLVVCLGLQLAGARNPRMQSRFENVLFWGFGAAMVLFAALRPIGMARDDLAYVEIYKSICPTLQCNQWIQGGGRDWGWYSLVGLLKGIAFTPGVMLGIAAFAVFIKLWVIFRLVRYPMMALLLFTGVFYQVQDLTAFRVSLSLAFFMLAILVYMARGGLLGAGALLLPGLFHKQGFLVIGLIIAPIFRQRLWLLAMAMVSPFMLLWVFGKPAVPQWIIKPGSMEALQQGLEAYVAGYVSGAFQQDKLVPWALYPLAALGLWLAKEVFEQNQSLYSVVAASMAIGCGLLYFFSSLTVAQVRFFEFFMLPVVLLAGCANRHWLNFALIAMVSGAWVLRHNILHPLLF